MIDVDTDEVLKFLSTWKTRKELEEKFKLSNSASFHLLTWLKKARLVEGIYIKREKDENGNTIVEAGVNKTNRVWVYKTIKK